MPVTDQVCAIVADIMDDDGIMVGPLDSQDTIEAWDSLASVHIFTAINQEFSLQIGVEHFGEFYSIPSIVALIEKMRKSE